jgi:hypothetical protein
MARRWARGAGIVLALLVWLTFPGGMQPYSRAPALPATQVSASNGEHFQVVSQSAKLGGLDLNSYCISQGYVSVSLDGRTTNDWHCVDSAGKHFGLSPGDACKWQYQTNAIGRWDDFNDPYSWNCFALAPTGGSSTNAAPIDWHTTAQDHYQNTGSQYTYSCPPNGTLDSIWGTDVYTYDSKICPAAVHAGLITLANGGTVKIEIMAGQSSYTGSTRNGVTSASWGGFGGSYRFVR